MDAPKSYAVDSQYLFDRLNQCNGDYQEAFQGIDGWWGLSWFNGERFYLQAYGNDVAIGRLDGSYYYSSDWRHLEAVGVKQNTIRILEWGDTIAFDCKSKGYEELSAFVDMSPLLAACASDLRTGAISGGRGMSGKRAKSATARTTGILRMSATGNFGKRSGRSI